MGMLFSMTAKLRVVFAGTPQNAADTLERLVSVGIHIVGVLTRTDARVGRSGELTPSAVAQKAHDLGLETFKTDKIDDQALEWLKSLNSDIGAVVAYGVIFKQPALEVPRLGWLNLHYSLLPELPGPAPVQHAILQGKKETGVTVFRLDAGIDTGPIIASTEQVISDADTAGSVLTKLTGIGSELLATILQQDEAKLALARPQEVSVVHATATKPTRELARLDFTGDALTQLNKIRAMNPEPMAWFELNGTIIRVIQAKFQESTSEVSTMRIIEKQLVVDCKTGSLVLELLQPAGKRQMSGADWFRGLRVEKLKMS
jgi:methionyl-tRNA formyltransferase